MWRKIDRSSLQGKRPPALHRERPDSRLEISRRLWFTSFGVTYFFIFVVTLVVGAMGTLMIAERLKRSEKRAGETRQRPAAKGKGRDKKRRRR